MPPVLEIQVRNKEVVTLRENPAGEFPAFDHFPVAGHEDPVECRVRRGTADHTRYEVGEGFPHRRAVLFDAAEDFHRVGMAAATRPGTLMPAEAYKCTPIREDPFGQVKIPTTLP